MSSLGVASQNWVWGFFVRRWSLCVNFMTLALLVPEIQRGGGGGSEEPPQSQIDQKSPVWIGLNEESFLNQISLSLISLFVTSLTPLQLVCLRKNCPTILRRSERSIRYLGRCKAVRLQSRTRSVLTREGLMHLAGTIPTEVWRKLHFFRLPKSWKLLSRPATIRRTISFSNQHQATEGQSVNKVNVHSVPSLLQAGSLSRNLPKWREFTSDPWIL